jgi:elongation factor P hydroxylase
MTVSRTTSWMVAGSIPDDVIEVFHWYYPSGRTMAVGSMQPLKEMSTGGGEVKATGA